MENALRTGESAVRTPRPLTSKEEREYDQEQNARKEQQEKERKRREEELREKESPAYPDVSPAYEPPEDYVPGYLNTGSPIYDPGSPVYEPKSPAYAPGSPAYNLGGSSVHSVADFDLGEQVYFTRSVDLGLPQNHAWKVAKKGGSLLTLTTTRDAMIGGDIGSNLTNSDLVQIAKPDELMKYDAYNQWEAQQAQQMQRGGDYNYPFGPQQQHLMPQQHVMQQPPPMSQVPQINIKMVGGNDFSKGTDGKGADGNGTESEGAAVMTGGNNQDAAFNNLVIPSMKGGAANPSIKKDSQEKQKTILGGLADFGNLVINKIM